MRPPVCLHTSYYAWKACPGVGRSFRLLGEAGAIHPKRLLAFHPPKVRNTDELLSATFGTFREITLALSSYILVYFSFAIMTTLI